MIRKTSIRSSSAGFTLLEMIVIIVIIAVLFAIAAPGWLAFISRQRVNAVYNDATQAIRSAQAEARQRRSPRIVQFIFNPANNRDTPQVIVGPTNPAATAGGCPTAVAAPARILADSTVRPGQVRLYTSTSTSNAVTGIVFDERGNVQCFRTAAGSLGADQLGTGFMVTAYAINRRNNTPMQQKCVIVGTILGAIYTDSGAFSGGRGCRTP